MTKADIISEITEQTGLQKKEVAVVVESFMNTVKSSMLDRKRMCIFVVSAALLSSIALPRPHVILVRRLLLPLRLTTFQVSSRQKLSLMR